MKQVPHITKEQALIAFSGAVVPLTLLELYNERIDAANAEQATQDQFITADEASALGAGNAEYCYELWGGGWSCWLPCTKDCRYKPADKSWNVKYRAIRKEVPAEPTCQVRNLDTGVTETITREAAKLLQAELGDTVEWFLRDDPLTAGLSHAFDAPQGVGIYTYRSKAKKQVNLDPAIREGVIALLQELNLIK